MKRITLLSVASLILIAYSFAAVPKNDGQFWAEIDTTANIAPRTTATVLATSRIGDDLPNPALSGGGLQLDFVDGPWALSGGALFVGVRNAGTGATTDVQLPLFAVTYSQKMAGVTISDRNRIEQLDGIPGSPTRFRNRLSIDFPTHNCGPISHAFVDDEGFYDFATSRWTRNRAQIGVGLPLTSSTEVQVFFLRQDNRSGSPRSLSVIGTTLKVFL